MITGKELLSKSFEAFKDNPWLIAIIAGGLLFLYMVIAMKAYQKTSDWMTAAWRGLWWLFLGAGLFAFLLLVRQGTIVLW